MSGRNRYLDVRSQYGNLWEAFEKRSGLELAKASQKPLQPCIFLSHRSTDKAAVRKIGEYIMERGIDVYLDADDPNLQQADRFNDHKAITAAIELGIANSTDLLAYLTVNTAESPWVPYEIGFAKRNGNYLAAMKSKELSRLPSYLAIVRQITGVVSLNAYLRDVLNRQTSADLVGTIRRALVLEQLKQASYGSELSSFLDSQ
jgi:hypothetical protein